MILNGLLPERPPTTTLIPEVITVNQGMDQKEWFLTSFVADGHKPEAWSGWHANNIFFVCTDASGIADSVFNAIEGNLQGNSQLLLVWNYNRSTGYTVDSLHSTQFNSFRLDSLTAPNVLQRREVIPGQVNWEWVNSRVHDCCIKIDESQVSDVEGDFSWIDENETKVFGVRRTCFESKFADLRQRSAVFFSHLNGLS